MSYMKIGNTRIRERGKKVDMFQKVKEIKRRIREIYPEIDDKRILRLMSSCRRFYEGKLIVGRRGSSKAMKRELTKIEKGIYTLMLEMNLNPSTTYRWFLAVRYPSDIKDKMDKGQISNRLAQKLASNRYKETQSQQSFIILDEIRRNVRRL